MAIGKTEQLMYDALSGGCGTFTASYIYDRLSAANLLHDPEEVARGREALEACVAYAEHFNNDPLIPVGKAVSAIGRAELERRKPRPRWTVEPTPSGGWNAVFNGPSAGFAVRFPSDAEPEARAYVARKNAEAK